MARISLSDVNSLPDLMSTDRYELILGNIPGGNPTRPLAIKCQMITLGGVQIETVPTTLHGHTVNFRGRNIFDNSMQATFVEDNTMGTMKALQAWKQLIVGTNSGGGLSKKAGYAITQVQVKLYKETNALATTQYIYNVFLSDIQSIQLDGMNSQIMLVNAMFTYDWWEWSDLTPTL
jgi:hypothetical protein